MTEHDIRELIASVIKQAVLDLSYRCQEYECAPSRRGALGTRSFAKHERGVRAEAAEWLRGDVCKDYCEFLEIDHGAVARRARGGKR